MLSCNKYRIARLLSLLVLFGVPVTTAWAQDSKMQIVPLRKIDARDTLLYGVCRAEKMQQVDVLIKKLTELWARTPDAETIKSLEKEVKRLSDNGSKKRAEQEKEIRQWIAEIEQSSDSDWVATARATGETAGEVKRRNLERHRKDLDKLLKYDDTPRQKELAKYQEALRQAKSANGSTEEQYTVKREIASLMVDGRLHDYEEVRDFYHGRAAASREVNKQTLWGFIDENARVVIPFQYRWVYDFNNRKPFNSSAFEVIKDQDDRGWTSVRYAKNGLMGMIDRDGNVTIPYKFIYDEHRHGAIIFIKTHGGEFAPVCVLLKGGVKKEGIIDRNGNYTLKPIHDHIVYYDDLQCFGTTGKNCVYFDPYGNKIEH